MVSQMDGVGVDGRVSASVYTLIEYKIFYSGKILIKSVFVVPRDSRQLG